jgi:hypothetical protein
MRSFFKKLIGFLLIGAIPLAIALFGYFYFDPFKVLYNYKDSSVLYTNPNRDYISTEMFLRNHNKYHYNSFVFGSSRSLAFRPGSWKKYLNKQDCLFKFDASGETIYGIYKKLKYLERIHAKIDNVLIILDVGNSFETDKNYEDHLFIKHPLTSEESYFIFQTTFFRAYLNPKFLFTFYVYKFTHRWEEWMSECIEDPSKNQYDSISNQQGSNFKENEITSNPAQYYLKHKDIFYTRKGERVSPIQKINEKQLIMLQEIVMILKRNNTKYKVVISPLYNQEKFSLNDMKILKNILENNLYDFSGKNSFTEPVTNYYETSHFRSSVADSILSIIYK